MSSCVALSPVSKIKEQNRLADLIPKDDPALAVGLGGRKKPDKIMDVKEMSSFRRGKSKVFYASDIWDPGEEARTSFRSACSDEDDDRWNLHKVTVSIS